MNNLEENLNKIKIKDLTEENKYSLWHSIVVGRFELENKKSRLLGFNIFNFSMKKIIAGVIVFVVILGGAGVVAASNSAVPGSPLFPVELALENMQIKLSNNEKKEELRLRFVEERLEEIREVSEKRSVPTNALVADLSMAVVLQIEADVFTNETTVKIEADNKNYGYISTLKTQAELVTEISLKYSLTEEKVNSVIDFEVDDRESKADDKGFLNKTRSINFSEKESNDVSDVLSYIDEFLNKEENNQNKEELKKSLADILILLGDDGELEIKRSNGKIKIEAKNGEVKIKIEAENDNSKNDIEDIDDSKDDDSDDDSNDEDSKDDDIKDDDSDDDGDDSNLIKDVKEDVSEIFCRGEWRDSEDCDDDDDDRGTDNNKEGDYRDDDSDEDSSDDVDEDDDNDDEDDN